MVLSALILLFSYYYQQKNMPPTPAPQPVTQTSAQEPVKPAQPLTPEAPSTGKPSVKPSADDTKAAARKIVIAGPKYRAVIDNQGAVLTSWELNDYKAARIENKSWFDHVLNRGSKDEKSDQRPVFEMIAKSQSKDSPSWPASLIFSSDDSLTALANREFYQVSIEGELGNGDILTAPTTVVLKLKRDDLSIEKRFRFEKDRYLVELSMSCMKGGKPLEGRFFLGEDLGPATEHSLNPAALEAVYYAGGKAKRENPPKNEEKKTLGEGAVQWVGLNMHYFAMIVIPDQPLSYFDIQKRTIKEKVYGVEGEVTRDLLRVTTPVNGALQYKMYFGPKNQADLEAVNSTLSDAINFGWFSIIVSPLLISLRYIFQFVHNYGYAIIVLTLLLSLLLFPFRLKQIVSMKKMQVVQPKVKAIQEKYKKYKATDPKRAEMNQEVMALYKEHGVNPLGGCLPLLLQMPLLYAFYSLLQYSIELRQAPFLLWIHDLAVKDPTYLLPIVMGATMFISQKMTPMTPGADPTQAKVMMVMPVVFTALFFKVSSGLNLYFLCSNIFQIAFQKIAERWISGGSSGTKSKS